MTLPSSRSFPTPKGFGFQLTQITNSSTRACDQTLVDHRHELSTNLAQL